MPGNKPKRRSSRRKPARKPNKIPNQEPDFSVPDTSVDPVDVNGIPVPEMPTTKPTINNYKDLAADWTSIELEHYLQCAKATGNSRIPPTILDEARALEEELTTRLKVLSLAGGITYDTLRYGVLSDPSSSSV